MNKHAQNDKLVNDVSQQLDHSLNKLDDDVKQRLSYNRQQAVNNTKIKISLFSRFKLNPAPVFIAAALLLITASISLLPDKQRGDRLIISADYKIEDDDIIAEYELLNDLEFISWLIEEEHQDENNAS